MNYVWLLSSIFILIDSSEALNYSKWRKILQWLNPDYSQADCHLAPLGNLCKKLEHSQVCTMLSFFHFPAYSDFADYYTMVSGQNSYQWTSKCSIFLLEQAIYPSIINKMHPPRLSWKGIIIVNIEEHAEGHYLKNIGQGSPHLPIIMLLTRSKVSNEGFQINSFSTVLILNEYRMKPF